MRLQVVYSFKVLKPEVGVDQKYADGKNGSYWIREAKVCLVPVKTGPADHFCIRNS